MILVLGPADDRCVREVLSRLRHDGRETLSVTAEDVRRSLILDWERAEDGPRGRVALGNAEVPLGQLDGVLMRLGSIFQAPFGESDDESYRRIEWAALLYGLLDGLPCPVINRPRPGIPFRSPAGRTVAPRVRAAGFVPARTLVTVSAGAALAFYDASGQRVYSRLPASPAGDFLEGAAGRETLESWRGRSFRLQAAPAGLRRRIIAAGRKVFAAEPVGGPAGESWRSVDVPETLAARYAGLAEGLGLPFAGFAAVSGDDGRDTLLAIDDAPSFEGLPDTVCRDAAEAVCGLLRRGSRGEDAS